MSEAATIDWKSWQLDWQVWQPTERATLLFVVRAGEILLIHKKRGLGAGKVNGPGGRREPGESPLACAIRETQEEVRITPSSIAHGGQLSFQFTDGYGLFVDVFRASVIAGEPQETSEATPFWCAVDAIPYEQMWADDEVWLPHLLAGRKFKGRFLFAGDRMLAHDLELGGAVG